jgi:hypothetical protein
MSRTIVTLCIVAAVARLLGAAPVPPKPLPGLARMASPAIDAASIPNTMAVALDGELTDDAWSLVTPATEFVQREPREGAAPSQRTEIRVLYDKSFLYVAVRALDTEPGRIVGIRTRRDLESPSDWIRVVIDSYHDRRTAYEFAVNPAGVKRDAYWFADGDQDTSWDAVWDVSVARKPDGWSAEFRIPFSQLRFEPGKADTFGLAVLREIGRMRETSAWPLIAKSRSGFVSQFGDLRGLKLIGAPKRLELMPYTVGQVETSPVSTGDPFQSSPDPGGSVGADIKYALTPGLTMTATINPDFGQVEADPAVVNLTAFETFYQERRPFFVEGSGNFAFDLDCNDGRCTGLFYSRRIGRQPHGSPDVPDDGYVSAPAQTTILGAAKLTGRAGPFSIGGLSAFTAPEVAQIASGTERWQQRVEPFSAYTVLQAKREWRNQSSLGFMFTNTARRLTDDVRSLPGSATTGGVNGDWRLKDARYAVRGHWAGSTIRGDAEAIDAIQQNAVHNLQRPDADHFIYDPSRTSLNGHAGMLSLQKIGGSRVRFSFSGDYKTPGFDINDVGYLRRADQVMQSGWVQIRWDTPTTWYRQLRFNLNQWAGWNTGGDRRLLGSNVNAHIVFTSNWSAGGGVTLEGAGYDDRATRGGPAMTSKQGSTVWCYVESDSRKAVSGVVSGFRFRDESGSSMNSIQPELTWRPTSFLSLTGGLVFETTDEDSQWVENVAGPSSTHYVFGRIEQTTASLSARVNYTISPNVSLQLYAQPFVSAGAYSGFRELSAPRATPYAAQLSPYPYEGNPDFNYKSFRMTNVLRWEYKPGSVLYVVWQQGREDVASQGQFDGRRDFGQVFGLPASNVFLVKASYWFNF